jgi:hypothetical protein
MEHGNVAPAAAHFLVIHVRDSPPIAQTAREFHSRCNRPVSFWSYARLGNPLPETSQKRCQVQYSPAAAEIGRKNRTRKSLLTSGFVESAFNRREPRQIARLLVSCGQRVELVLRADRVGKDCGLIVITRLEILTIVVEAAWHALRELRRAIDAFSVPPLTMI